MSLNFIDRYQGTLASGYTSGGGTLTITSATSTVGSAVLPSGACDFYLNVRAEGSNTTEIFLVTNRSGTTLTVTGAQASTSASNHASGAVITASIMTAAAYAQLKLDALTIGNAVTSATSGSVLGVNSGNLAQDNANLFWDFVNHYLGIGINTPGHPLHVYADNPLSSMIPIEQVIIENPTTSGTTTQAMIGFKVWDGSAHTICGWITHTSGTFSFSPHPNALWVENNSSGGIVIAADTPATAIHFLVGGYTSDDFERFKITEGGPTVQGADGSGQALIITQTAHNATASKSYIPIDFYDNTTLNCQIIATAGNYASAGSAINIGANSLGVLVESTAGTLLLGAAGSSGVVNINAGGYDSAHTTMSFPAAGGVSVLRGGVALTGAGGSDYIKADGSGYGTPSGTTVPTSQTDVTSSRALATVYHNTGTTPKFIQATVQGTSSGNVSAFTDASNPPTTNVAAHSANASGAYNVYLGFWVLAGNYYKITSTMGSAAVVIWFELA